MSLTRTQNADEKAISRHYKRLSLIYHPDKIKPDPAKNETIETLNERFVEITKAYKALTDEEIRNNYIQYGHPDGKQSFSIGIALPQFIVTEGNGKYVLLIYGGLLGVLLPYIVGRWWYGSQRYTKEGVLVASAGNIFREYKDDMKDPGVIGALSSGAEFQEMLQGQRAQVGLAKLEKKVLSEDVSFLPPQARDTLKQMDDFSRRKALALLWAYLGRIDLENAALNGGRFLCFHRFWYLVLTIPFREIRSRIDCVVPGRSLFRYCSCLRKRAPNSGGFPHVAEPDSGRGPGVVAASAAAVL